MEGDAREDFGDDGKADISMNSMQGKEKQDKKLCQGRVCGTSKTGRGRVSGAS